MVMRSINWQPSTCLGGRGKQTQINTWLALLYRNRATFWASWVGNCVKLFRGHRQGFSEEFNSVAGQESYWLHDWCTCTTSQREARLAEPCDGYTNILCLHHWWSAVVCSPFYRMINVTPGGHFMMPSIPSYFGRVLEQGTELTSWRNEIVQLL